MGHSDDVIVMGRGVESKAELAHCTSTSKDERLLLTAVPGAFCARCIAFAHGFAILSCVSGWPSHFFVPVSTMRVASVMYALMTRGWGCTHQHINSMGD